MIVLDTNVISELVRPSPSPIVLRRLRSLPDHELYTTAITEAEIRYGLAIQARGRRHAVLSSQLDLIFAEVFAGRILPFDSAAAPIYAAVVAKRRKAGRPIAAFDAQIAAICLSRNATLATRNMADFRGLHLPLLDPWAEESTRG
ncbi:MAG: type II toxin-antitoxin system VapC family toxin [Candidatus Solibacter sp.]